MTGSVKLPLWCHCCSVPVCSLQPFQTPVHETRTINPAFNFKKTFRPVVTQDFIDYLQKDALEFEVYGRTSGKKAAPAVPIAGSGSGGGGGGGGAPRSSVSDQEVAKYKAELAKEKEERDRLAAELEKATKQRSAMESTVKELETKVKNAREEALKALESSGGGDEAAQKAARAEFEMKAAVRSACALCLLPSLLFHSLVAAERGIGSIPPGGRQLEGAVEGVGGSKESCI